MEKTPRRDEAFGLSVPAMLTRRSCFDVEQTVGKEEGGSGELRLILM
jgi:hypothetical protein